MSFSDFLQIILSLIGFMVGTGVSWMFFRAQQKTDFVALRDAIQSLKNNEIKNINTDIAIIKKTNDITEYFQLNDAIQSLKNNEIKNIDRNIAIIKKSNDVAEYLQLNKEMIELHNSINRLNSDVNGLPQKIISDFRIEQNTFLERVNGKFNDKVNESQVTLEKHLRRELGNFLPTLNQQDKIVERMSELVKYAMISMGKYQLEVVASESEDVLARTEQKVNSAITPVSRKLEGVDKQVEHLSALPEPKRISR